MLRKNRSVKSWGVLGIILRENRWVNSTIMGESWDNHGESMGKSWENHGIVDVPNQMDGLFQGKSY